MRKASRKAKRVEVLSENVYGNREGRLPVRKRGGGSQWMWAAVPINLQRSKGEKIRTGKEKTAFLFLAPGKEG